MSFRILKSQRRCQAREGGNDKRSQNPSNFSGLAAAESATGVVALLPSNRGTTKSALLSYREGYCMSDLAMQRQYGMMT